jgi:hypothetical protein
MLYGEDPTSNHSNERLDLKDGETVGIAFAPGKDLLHLAAPIQI